MGALIYFKFHIKVEKNHEMIGLVPHTLFVFQSCFFQFQSVMSENKEQLPVEIKPFTVPQNKIFK